MRHAWAFLHFCHLPVSGVSIAVLLFSVIMSLTTISFILEFQHSVFCLSEEIGLSLSIPVISAGSFGLSCDYKPKLTRILPPARKISNLFTHFLKETLAFKEEWKQVYVYKKSSNTTEDCFW